MKLNAPIPPVFTVPDSVPVVGVDAIRPITPIGEDAVVERREAREDRASAQEAATPQEAEVPSVDRRLREERRDRERRQRQIPVLIDTRTGRDRRASARRDDDEPPPGGVDVKV